MGEEPEGAAPLAECFRWAEEEAEEEAAWAAPCLTAPAIPFAPSFWVVVPLGVVTVIMLDSDGSIEHSMRYPGGRKVLKP